jgi:hypothetical protein
MIGSMPKMLSAVKGLPISDADKTAILGGTIARLIARA